MYGAKNVVFLPFEILNLLHLIPLGALVLNLQHLEKFDPMGQKLTNQTISLNVV